MRKKAFLYLDSEGLRHVFDYRYEAEIEYLYYENPCSANERTSKVRAVYRVYKVVLKDGRAFKARLSHDCKQLVELKTGFSYFRSDVASFTDITMAYYLQGGDILYA